LRNTPFMTGPVSEPRSSSKDAHCFAGGATTQKDKADVSNSSVGEADVTGAMNA